MLKKPSRANGTENKIIKAFLESRCKIRYGTILCEVCLGKDCGCKDEKTSENKLINEHINGDSNDWHPDNLRLSSQSCNVKEWHKKRSKVGVEKKEERKRERGSGKDVLIRQMIEFKDLKMETVAMFKSTYLKAEVFIYVEKEMMRSPIEGVWLEELANDCSNLFGLSVNKCREYILSKTFKTGPYMTEEKEGRKFLIWKIRYLEKKYQNELR
jgi:hypothetical protein